MSKKREHPSSDPTIEQVEQALESFWRGSPEEFDRLIEEENGDESEPAICDLLSGVPDYVSGWTGLPPRIGDYAIIREIGHGGMAVVFEARQERTGRTVALKVIRRWGTTPESQVRFFRRELDTLARLKHPHIATLYDAGRTPEGLYFFAIELVGGVSLADYQAEDAKHTGDRNSIRRRLTLFEKICRAMIYAHRRGVIHCDLKPSNIFIDPQGEPKILDFGLARLLDPDAMVTLSSGDTGKIIGTLAYMSPEQARGRVEEIDVRSDEYALGVLLYELLTGRHPHGVHGTPLPETIRRICEAPPARPGAVASELRGDLETILLKALEKEPARRYQSVAELAEDIERYLAHRPILAHAPSTVYQLRKLIARHRLPAALMAALFLLVCTFAVIFVAQAAQVVDERDNARAESRRATQINEYLERMLASLNPHEVGLEVPVREILDRAAAGIDAELEGQPEIRASLHDTLGRGYLALRLYDQAEVQFQAALNLRRSLHGERHPLFATSLHQLGLIPDRGGKAGARNKNLERAYRLRRELLGEEHVDVAESLDALAYFERGRNPKKAEQLYREALAMRRKLLGEHRLVADSLYHLAVLLVEGGRYEEAEPLLNEALALRRKLLGPDHHEVATTLTDLGEIYFRRAAYDRAEAAHREQIRIWRGIFGENGNAELTWAMSDLAGILQVKGEFVEAEQLFRDSVALARRLPGDGQEILPLNNFAAFLCDQGRYREAEPLSRIVFRAWRGDAAEPHPAKGYACQNLAIALLELGQYQEAEQLFRDAISNWRALFGSQNPKLARALIGLGRLKQLHGENIEAEALFREAVEVRRARLGEAHALAAEGMIYLGGILHAQGKPGAEDLLREALDLVRGNANPQKDMVAWALCRLARLLKERGNTTEAAAMFHEAIEIERRLPREKHPVLAACLTGLGEILLDRGDAAAAEPLLREALDIRVLRFSEDDPRTVRTREVLRASITSQTSEATVEGTK